MLRSPLDRARSVLTFRARCSVSRDCAPVVWVFSTSGFSSLVRDEACQFRNQKAERWSGANHSSIGDSWPIAFSGYPRGPRVGWETGCPKHAAPNLPAETRSRTRVSREPDGHRQRNPQRWSGRLPNYRRPISMWAGVCVGNIHRKTPVVGSDVRGFKCHLRWAKQARHCIFQSPGVSHRLNTKDLNLSSPRRRPNSLNAKNGMNVLKTTNDFASRSYNRTL